MAIQVLNDYISIDFARSLSSFLEPLLKDTPRAGMRSALGYETSSEAARVGYGYPAVSGYENTAYEPIVKNIEDLYKKVRTTLEDHFGVEMDLVNCVYQELTTGASNELHADRTRLDGTPWREDGVEEELEFSALLYMNTHGVDYEGGEIEFPLQNLVITPKTGQFVFFKGDLDHIHEVKTVLSGTRKNLVFFFSRKGNISDLNHFPDSKYSNTDY